MKYKFKDGGVVKLQNAWTTMPNPEDSIRRAWETQAQREREAAFTDSLGYITQGDGKKRNALTRWAQDTAKGQEAVRALNTLKWAADKGLMLAGGNWLLKGLKAKKYLTTAGELVGGAAGAEGLNQAGKWVDNKLGTSNPFLDFQKLGTLSGVILGASGAKKGLQWAAGKGVNLPASNMEFNNLRTQYLNNIAGKAKIQTPNKGWENYSNYDVYENAFKNKPSVDLSEPITMDEAKASASRWLGDRIQLGDPEILKGLQIAPSSTPETGYIDFYDTSKPMNKSLRKTFYAAPGGQGHSYGRPVIQGVMHRTVDGTEYLEYPRNSNIRYYLGKFKTEGKEPTLVHIGPPNMDGTVMKPRPDPLRRVDQDFLWWQRNNPFWSKGEITTRINDVVPSKSAIGNVNSDYPTRLTGPVDLADPKLNTVQMQYNPLTKTFGWMKYVVPKESGPTPQEAATTYHWDPRAKVMSRPISDAELAGTPRSDRNQPAPRHHIPISLINRSNSYLPIEGDSFALESPEVSKRLASVHFTINEPVTGNSGGSWDSASTTLLFPYGNLRKVAAPINLEPMDTFFPNYNGLRFSTKGAKVFTGDRAVHDYYTQHGVDSKFSEELEALLREYNTKNSVADKYLAEHDWLPDEEYYKLHKAETDVSDKIQQMHFDFVDQNAERPSLEDVHRLEQIEGLKTGADPVRYDGMATDLQRRLGYTWFSAPSTHWALTMYEPGEDISKLPKGMQDFVRWIWAHKADYR